MPPVAAEPVSRIRKKLFYRINEVSKITALKPYILRYWETEFPQISPEKDENDQRRYRQEDIDLILKIKDLLYEQKFTIAGAKQKIAAEAAPGRTARAEKRAEPKTEPRSEPRTAESAPPTGPIANDLAARLGAQLAAIRAELEDLLLCLG